MQNLSFQAEQSRQDQRKTVWVTAWTSVANANDCKSPDRATVWADACLQDFIERFESNDVSI